MAREAALMLAGEGSKVAIVARTQVPIDETVELIRSRGGTAMGVSADLTTRDGVRNAVAAVRSEEHTSELQSLMRISYAVFCLKKKKATTNKQQTTNPTNKDKATI